MTILTILRANWQAPDNIMGLTTYRHGGVSLAPFDSNNMALHVGDNPQHVQTNRNQLIEELNLPAQPEWLEQTHSTTCVIVEDEANRQADAAITRSSQHVLAIMTADCLPILLCDLQGQEIAAIHAGWRGLAHGIIENTLMKMHASANQLIAWIGPAICQNCYETGHEVFEQFSEKYAFAAPYFLPFQQKWHADLSGLAERILLESGLNKVYQSNKCTFENKNEFYSYRRSPQTGRMVSLVWFNTRKQD